MRIGGFWAMVRALSDGGGWEGAVDNNSEPS